MSEGRLETLVQIGRALRDRAQMATIKDRRLDADDVLLLYQLAVHSVTDVLLEDHGEPFARGVGEKMFREGL